MKFRVIIKKKHNKDEKFSFIISEYNLSNFFENLFDLFDNYEELEIEFLKIDESEE